MSPVDKMKNAPPRPPVSFFLFCQGRKLRTGLSTGDLLLDNQCFFRGGKQANFAGAPGARSASLHRWRRFNRRERRASPRRLPSAHSHTSASIPAHRPAKENVPQQSKWDLGNFFRPALEKKSLRTLTLKEKKPKLMSVVPPDTKAGLFTVSSPPI